MSDPQENSDDNLSSVDSRLPSHLATIAIQLHEMYSELQNAGFKRDEAIELIGYAIAAGVMDPYYYGSADGSTLSITIDLNDDDEEFDEDEDEGDESA